MCYVNSLHKLTYTSWAIFRGGTLAKLLQTIAFSYQCYFNYFSLEEFLVLFCFFFCVSIWLQVPMKSSWLSAHTSDDSVSAQTWEDLVTLIRGQLMLSAFLCAGIINNRLHPASLQTAQTWQVWCKDRKKIINLYNHFPLPTELYATPNTSRKGHLVHTFLRALDSPCQLQFYTSHYSCAH